MTETRFDFDLTPKSSADSIISGSAPRKHGLHQPRLSVLFPAAGAGLYYLLPFRARTALIAVSSYVFYGWANPIWAVIMFFGSSVDYVCGIALLKLSRLPDERRPAAGDRPRGAAHARR